MTATHIGPVPLTDPIAADRWRGVLEGEPVEARRIDPTWEGAYARFDGSAGQARVRASHAQGVILAPLDAHTLAGVAGPLPASAVAFVGVRLASALVAAGGWPAPLTAEQIGLDPAGHPVLAPLGPVDTALPEARAATPPEGVGTAEAALYGLGALLYALATGTRPSGELPPAPSSRQPGLPPALDAAILGLLSPAPASRAGAVRELAALAEPADLRRYPQAGGRFARATLDAGEVAYTKVAPAARRAALDVRPPAAAVVVPAAQLAELPPPALSALAGVTALPLASVKRAIAEGRPLVVEALTHPRGVATAAIQRQRALDMPLTPVRGPGFGRLLEVLFFAGAALGLGTLGVGLGSWGVLAAAALASILALVSVYGGVRTARAKAEAVAAHAAQERARAEAPAWIADIAARRRALADAELPEPVERDAREVLDALELADEAEVRRGLDALSPLLASEGAPGKAADRAERIAALHRHAVRETR